MNRYREILVAAAGLTPQVITETLYYLTQRHDPPIAISEIHVLTTRLGQQRILAQLLTPGAGRFYTLCAEYGLDPAAIGFDARHVHVLKDAAGLPLDDIRTADDSSAVADQIAAFIRHLTDDPGTRLHCSLAGGRKTQSVLLGFALQLYGRAQDTLLHVLVSEEFEDHPEFFYPAKEFRLLRARDGRPVDAHQGRVDVAEVPYLRLREKLLAGEPCSTTGFGPTIAWAQQALDLLPSLAPLAITWAARQVAIGGVEIPLEPLEIILYAQLAQAKLEPAGGDGFLSLNELDNKRELLLQRYARLYGIHSGRVEALRRRWGEKGGIPTESLRSHFANINRKLCSAIPDPTQAVFYRVSGEGPYGATRYGLHLPPEKIELREE